MQLRSRAHSAERRVFEFENDFQKWYGWIMVTSLAEIPLGRTVRVRSIAGPRAFRRRLLEMGLIPGTVVRVITIAPLGDPLRIEVRHGQWSIRRAEAAQIEIEPPDVSAAPSSSTTSSRADVAPTGRAE
jgi:ferrous iron transport protein A